MKLLKLIGSPEKKTEKLNGSPICPIKVGRIAVIPKDVRKEISSLDFPSDPVVKNLPAGYPF